MYMSYMGYKPENPKKYKGDLVISFIVLFGNENSRDIVI